MKKSEEHIKRNSCHIWAPKMAPRCLCALGLALHLQPRRALLVHAPWPLAALKLPDGLSSVSTNHMIDLVLVWDGMGELRPSGPCVHLSLPLCPLFSKTFGLYSTW